MKEYQNPILAFFCEHPVYCTKQIAQNKLHKANCTKQITGSIMNKA